jgi:hypothetical protein
MDGPPGVDEKRTRTGPIIHFQQTSCLRAGFDHDLVKPVGHGKMLALFTAEEKTAISELA